MAISIISPCQAQPEEFVKLKDHVRTFQKSWIPTFTRTLFGNARAMPQHLSNAQVDVPVQVAAGAAIRDSARCTSYAPRAVASCVTGLRLGEKNDEEQLRITQCNPDHRDKKVRSVRCIDERGNLIVIPWKTATTA